MQFLLPEVKYLSVMGIFDEVNDSSGSKAVAESEAEKRRKGREIADEVAIKPPKHGKKARILQKIWEKKS
jgi:hypothetical protein